MEKHWRSVVSKSICDYFFEAQEKATSSTDVPPVIATPHYYLITVYRCKIYFVAVVQSEVPPLFVIEFLHRVVDIFVEYFTECNERTIKEQYVIVYELLEEMLDNGFPLATESNILKELIRPPSILPSSVVTTITGKSQVSSTLPTGQLSNIPWRRTGVKYATNEIFLDLVEEVDAIIDKSGTTVVSEVHGKIEAVSKLSGMPDLTLSFNNGRLVEDVSFHPCVRFKRWEAERVLSFVPPDGQFLLISYTVGSTGTSCVALPMSLTPQFTFSEHGPCKFSVRALPRNTQGKILEDVKVTIPMPKCVSNVLPTATYGMPNYDPVKRTVIWNIGKLSPDRRIELNGTIRLQSGEVPDGNPTIEVEFKLAQIAVSGLRVNRLDVYGEKYKPFKGIKYVTRAGKFQIRS